MQNYDKNAVLLYLMHINANNLYERAMFQKLSVGGFKWVEDLSQFNKNFIKNYDENSDQEDILEVDIEYLENLFKLREQHDREKYVVQIRALKQALNRWLILKRVHRVIEFNQKALLKPYIDMNTELRREAKNEFEKHFFKLMNLCFCKINTKYKKLQRY